MMGQKVIERLKAAASPWQPRAGPPSGSAGCAERAFYQEAESVVGFPCWHRTVSLRQTVEEPGACARCGTVQQYKPLSSADLVLPASCCSAVLPVFGPEKGKAVCEGMTSCLTPWLL